MRGGPEAERLNVAYCTAKAAFPPLTAQLGLRWLSARARARGEGAGSGAGGSEMIKSRFEKTRKQKRRGLLLDC